MEAVDVAALLVAVTLMHGALPLYLWKPHATPVSENNPMQGRWMKPMKPDGPT
mgnify:CR=1 FL=1